MERISKNKSQNGKLILEKKILPPLLLDSNPRPFDHESGGLTTELPPFPLSLDIISDMLIVKTLIGDMGRKLTGVGVGFSCSSCPCVSRELMGERLHLISSVTCSDLIGDVGRRLTGRELTGERLHLILSVTC